MVETRRGPFYIDTIAIEIEDEIYKVPRHGFETWCTTPIRDAFARVADIASSCAPSSSDDQPICPMDCTKLEFESLMRVIYPWASPNTGDARSMSKEEWAAALKLATQWDMPEVALLIIGNMDELALSPAEKVVVGRCFKNPQWYREGCAEIVRDVTLDGLADMIGWEGAARIAWAAQDDTGRGGLVRKDELKPAQSAVCLVKGRHSAKN